MRDLEGCTMPKLNDRLPSYRKHKPSGLAVVTLNSKDHYLGPHVSLQVAAMIPLAVRS